MSVRAGPARPLWAWWVWGLVLTAVIAIAIAFVQWSGMRPYFDPFGWLDWARVILRGARLDLDAAPSWKPLPFLFTLPFSLFGGASVELWSVTAVAGTLLMGVFAARCVYRLSGVGAGDGRLRISAAWFAAGFAGLGELGMQRLDVLTYIANSDPLTTALVLAAVDAHLGRRHRLAYLALFFAALGRPEVWFVIAVYGVWMILTVPGTRRLVIGGWVLILVAWFLPDALWARSLTEAGKLDEDTSTAMKGDKVIGVLNRWVLLYEWPMQLAALLGVAIGLLRRDRRIIVLFGFVLLWLVVEIGFAYHGWSAVYRYLMEPAALMIVIAGDGVFRLLTAGVDPWLPRVSPRVARVLGALVLAGVIVAALPFIHDRERRWQAGRASARRAGVVNRNLSRAVALAGGRRALLRCGEIAAPAAYQSQLAWATAENVASIGSHPARLRKAHRRVVLFTRSGPGWTVRAEHEPAALAGACARRLDATIR